VPHIVNREMPASLQRKQLDLLQSLNRSRLEHDASTTELEGVIQSYELAFRMQGAVPKLMDISNESQSTLASYGIGEKSTDDFGRQCLLARRFAEAGVRFIELSYPGWDQHNGLTARLKSNCGGVDKPAAGAVGRP